MPENNTNLGKTIIENLWKLLFLLCFIYFLYLFQNTQNTLFVITINSNIQTRYLDSKNLNH